VQVLILLDMDQSQPTKIVQCLRWAQAMRRITKVVRERSAQTVRRLRPASIVGPLILALAYVSATAFLSAAIISVLVIWLPVAIWSLAFGVRRDSAHTVARPDPAAA